MALWSVFAAPMIMSVDLRHIRASSRALLQNRPAIAINQDRLGVQARRLKKVSAYMLRCATGQRVFIP